MIVRSSLVSGPGLVDDLVRNADLPDVVKQGRELSVAPLAGRQPQLVGDRERQIDDVAAVMARVRIVGLDDLAEQERGSAIGVPHLELVVDPHTPLAREDRQERDQRQCEQNAAGGGRSGERDREPDRREPGVDHAHGRHRPQVEPRPHAERSPFAAGRAHVVEDELRAEGCHVERPAREGRAPTRRRGPGRVPAQPRARRSGASAGCARDAASR